MPCAFASDRSWGCAALPVHTVSDVIRANGKDVSRCVSPQCMCGDAASVRPVLKKRKLNRLANWASCYEARILAEDDDAKKEQIPRGPMSARDDKSEEEAGRHRASSGAASFDPATVGRCAQDDDGKEKAGPSVATATLWTEVPELGASIGALRLRSLRSLWPRDTPDGGKSRSLRQAQGRLFDSARRPRFAQDDNRKKKQAPSIRMVDTLETATLLPFHWK